MQRLVWLVGLTLWLVGCVAPATPAPTATPPPTATPVLTHAEGVAQAFLQAWQNADYAGMYSLLSPLSRDAIRADQFEARYQNVFNSGTVIGLNTRLISVLQEGPQARALYEVTLNTLLVGDVVRRTEMPLVFLPEANRWAVAWAESMILPELAGGGTLNMEHRVPARGNIYDRDGRGLAVQGEAVAVGVQPGRIQDETTVLTALAQLLNTRPETIKARYATARPDWYVPLGEVAASEVQANFATLSQLAGVVLSRYTTRFYPEGGLAPHVVGYLSAIPPEQLATYRARGYTGDERVGITGLEAWGEAVLAGQRGGVLRVITPQGQVIPLAESPAQPAQAIYTTLDRNLQRAVQEALGSFRGAAIVMEVNTGDIVALASNPGFDPNLFDPTNRNSVDLNRVLADPGNPLLNRATQGLYPPGSTFKMVVGTAALQAGVVRPATQINCGWTWNGLGPNFIKYDWTFAARVPQRGRINLVQALAFSCNPYFYQVALDMHAITATLLPDHARAYGFGTVTGLVGVPEAAGLVGDPAWKQATLRQTWSAGDSVNLGIGQGFIQVTALQEAVMMAALANGGTRYRPQVIDRIVDVEGQIVQTFGPEVQGRLPLTPEQLALIQQGLRAVTQEAGGTARSRFLNFEIPVLGKTGTAEDPAGGLPHAWFVGYTAANRPERPDVAIVVVLENRGEGSIYAAPIFRRLVEIYFEGRASTLYPWESDFGVSVGNLNTVLQATPALPPVFSTPAP